MFKDSIEDMCIHINENFTSASEVDRFIIDLGGPALNFTQEAWHISMILAAVVFAIIACYELYAQSVRTEGHGGPMGSAEIVFKVMFKVAVCYIVLQVSFGLLIGLFGTSNDLIAAFGTIDPAGTYDDHLLDPEAVAALCPDGFFKGLGMWICCLIVFLLSWATKLAAWALILIRLVQVYLYLIVSPIPLATLPSHELSQIGKGFLKSFVAVCLQGALIYLVVQLFPVMIATVLSGSLQEADTLLSMLTISLLYSVAIIVTLMGTQQLSRRICGAA